MVDGIKVAVWMKIGMLEQTLCEVMSSLPECIMGMEIMSERGTLSLPNIVKQKTC